MYDMQNMMKKLPKLGEFAPAAFQAFVAFDQAAFLEPLQKAAEIAGVQAEIADERARGRILPMGELVEDAGLGQREGALEQPLLEHADAPGIEAVEAPDGGDAGR